VEGIASLPFETQEFLRNERRPRVALCPGHASPSPARARGSRLMKVKIDTRPLLIVILSRWWRFLVFILIGYALYHFYQQPPPEGLSVQGFRALTVFLACLILWVTRLLPLAVTGLFAMVAA